MCVVSASLEQEHIHHDTSCVQLSVCEQLCHTKPLHFYQSRVYTDCVVKQSGCMLKITLKQPLGRRKTLHTLLANNGCAFVRPVPCAPLSLLRTPRLLVTFIALEQPISGARTQLSWLRFALRSLEWHAPAASPVWGHSTRSASQGGIMQASRSAHRCCPSASKAAAVYATCPMAAPCVTTQQHVVRPRCGIATTATAAATSSGSCCASRMMGGGELGSAEEREGTCPLGHMGFSLGMGDSNGLHCLCLALMTYWVFVASGGHPEGNVCRRLSGVHHTSPTAALSPYGHNPHGLRRISYLTG